MNRRIFTVFLFAAVMAALSACATSLIVEHHHLWANNAEASARVVFFRPIPQRTHGIADNDVTIEVDNEKLMDLSAGEYAVFYLKPSEAKVTLRNLSFITYKVMPEEVTRARRFTFEADKTYFIQTRLKVEEYRGVYFEPREVDESKALEIISHLKPVNDPLG